MSDDGLRQVLARHGYRLLIREHDWVECLIASPTEAYEGLGLDREAALEAALSRCFPSRIARELFDVAVSAAARHVTPLTPRPEVEPPAPVDPAPMPMPDRTPQRVPPASPARAAILARPRDEVRRSPDRTRAIEELSILTERIEESRPELAWSTAPRQRLAILAWICEARSHTDVFPEDVEIRESVARVSRQLTEIGKAFWPGSVTALQLQMQPSDLPRHLLGGSPATWARAAELAERALASLEHSDERRGLDAYGWGDATLLSPEPTSPTDILDRLVDAVETSWGPLDRFAEPRNPDDLPVPGVYQQWVRELRWIRVQDVDPDQWARVMGRLRWWACRRNGPVQAEGRELEPSFRPERPWSSLLQQEGRPGEKALPATLVEQARHKFDGKRLLVISNRRDPEAQDRLTEALPGTVLQWRFAEPEFLEAIPRTLAEGGFDAVVGAVGLQSPTVDLALARGCRAASVPYARANRGQPSACLRALARVS